MYVYVRRCGWLAAGEADPRGFPSPVVFLPSFPHNQVLLFSKEYGLADVSIIHLRSQESSDVFFQDQSIQSYFLQSLGGCEQKGNLLKFSDCWRFVQMGQLSSHSYKIGKAKLCEHLGRSMESNRLDWSTRPYLSASPIDCCSSVFPTLRCKGRGNNWFPMQHILLISSSFIIISYSTFSSKWFINTD